MRVMHPTILLAAALSLGLSSLAQAAMPVPGRFLLLVATSTTPPTMDELQKLIGHSVHDAAGNYVGSIEAIHIARNNKVEGVIVGLAQADGTDHNVVLAWNNFQITETPGQEVAERVTVTVSPRILATLPAFQFSDPDLRGKVFGRID